MRIRILLLLLMAMLLPAAQPTKAAEPVKPVLAYYYGWWGSQTWNVNQLSDRPPTLYESESDAVMLRQIREAKQAGIDGFICTWRYTCERLLQLAEAEGGFNVTFSVDPVADGTLNSTSAIVQAMNEMAALTDSSAYLHWNGKPVFVFWNDTILPGGRGSKADWQALRNQTDPARQQWWLGGGVNFELLDVFDAIHFFDITWENSQGAAMNSYNRKLNEYNSSRGTNKPFIATVMPGYDDTRLRGPGHVVRDRNNGDYYRAGWDTATQYDAQAVIITSWNEWYEGSQIEPSVAYGDLYLDITRDKVAAYKRGFADAAFQRTWNRADKPVADNRAARSWLWGPALTGGMREPYNGGTRLVQYFDKSRMEINNPNGDRSQPWFVTNGLLVMEMISGRVQTGDNDFTNRGPANEALGGDPRAINPAAPGYKALAGVMGRQANRVGETITTQLLQDGSTIAITPPASVQYQTFVEQTGHSIPDVFWSFMNQNGTVYENNQFTSGQVMDWVFAFGYPITDAYWMRASLGGQETWMLVQAFERRILTYTPTNSAAFQVEMGNVGQHYYRWRYEQ